MESEINKKKKESTEKKDEKETRDRSEQRSGIDAFSGPINLSFNKFKSTRFFVCCLPFSNLPIFCHGILLFFFFFHFCLDLICFRCVFQPIGEKRYFTRQFYLILDEISNLSYYDKKIMSFSVNFLWMLIKTNLNLARYQSSHSFPAFLTYMLYFVSKIERNF